MPFWMLPIILVVAFALVVAFVSWMKFHEHLHILRHDDRRSHLVAARKLRPRRARLHGAPRATEVSESRQDPPKARRGPYFSLHKKMREAGSPSEATGR
jgi:hypothetical protein